MITKDHVTPKSNGGSNELSNLQPMCSICNTKKGSLPMKVFEERLVGKSYGWNVEHATRIIESIKELYALDVKMSEYGYFLNCVMYRSIVMHKIAHTRSYQLVRFKNKNIYVEYSSMYKSIYAVLDPTTVDARLKEVPRWGKGREKECLDLYDKILATIKTEFKVFPTEQETAEYFKTCKYQKLMFSYWKQQTSLNDEGKYRINCILWNVVKCTLKIDNSNDNDEERNRDKEKNDNLPIRKLCSTDGGKPL